MKLPGFITKVVDKVAEKRQTTKEKTELEALVQEWKEQFEIDRRAKAEWDENFVRWEGIYNGDKVFDNQTLTGRNADREMRTNINFPRMIVERLIDPNVPQPDFRAVAEDDEEAVECLKNYVDYVVRAAEPPLEEINLQDERRVKKFGGTFRKVHWNNNIKRAGNVGEIEISNPHPKDIIPNKGATSLQNLEHYHHLINYTGREIVRKWPWLDLQDLEDKATYYDDLDNLDSENTAFPSNDNYSGSEAKNTGLKKYTIIETTYRDEDGDLCKLWWSGDLGIKDVPKFYWRRDENGNPTQTEVLEAGTKVRRTKADGTSELITLETDTEVEFYIPTRWDIIYEPYIPRDKCFWGISLMEDIHDLNEAIKKAVYQAEERRLRGNKKILVDNDNDARKILDPTTEVVAITGTYHGTVDLGATDDILWIEKLKEWLQLLTGATNAAMGVEMPSVTSGEQAKVYVEQANKKIGNSSAYKAASYKQLYKVVADFALAFADGDRPFRLSGDRDKAEYGTFNRLTMLKDKSGNTFYPDYDVEIGADGGFMQQRGQIMQAILDLAGMGRFEASPANLRVLKILKKIGVPYLDDIIDDMQETIEQQELQAQQQPPPQPGGMPPEMAGSIPPMPEMQNALPAPPQEPMQGEIPPDIAQLIQQLPPDIQQQLLSMPPEQQAAFLMQLLQQGEQPQPQAGAGLPPEIEQVIAQLPPELQAQFMELLQVNPEAAMAMLQQVLGQQAGSF